VRATQITAPTPARDDDRSKIEVDVSGCVATRDAPLKVRLDPSPALRASIERAVREGRTVRLSIQIVEPHRGDWAGLSVHLNDPRADERTSIDSPGYVGSVAFYGGSEGETTTFMLNITPAVSHLMRAGKWRAGDALELFFVPVANDGRPAASHGIGIKKVSISVPQSQP
jgi:hypothetical protein